jgi:glutathione S-transferase
MKQRYEWRMILYSLAQSPYSAIVRVAVYAKAAPIEVAEPPGGVKSDAYRAISGTGQVPCLVLEDGTGLPESTVILGYLDDKFPEPPLTPVGPPEARARVALLVRLGIKGVVDPLVAMFHDMTEGLADAGAVARARIEVGFGRLERFVAGEGYAAGADFTQADCVLGPSLMGVAALGGLLGAPDLMAGFPKLAGYARRVATHPAVARVLGELQAAMAMAGV